MPQSYLMYPAFLCRAGKHPLPNPPPLRGRGFLAALGLALTVVSCNRPSIPTSPSLLQPQPQGTAGQLTAILPATDLAVGPNQRFMVVLLGPDNRIVSDATVDLAFFKVTGPEQAQLRGRAPTQYREAPGADGRGAYVARAEFDEPGQWGVAAQVLQPGQPPTELRLNFEVKDKSSTPGRGEVVPPSQTLTGTTPGEIERFSSARPADPKLYRLSVADALRERRPLVVLFATPGFCTSRLCGPSLEVLQTLQAEFDGLANFIHVEIYKDGRPNDRFELVAAVNEWGLTSEPWLFVVGADGRLADKFEGNITAQEVRPLLEGLSRPA